MKAFVIETRSGFFSIPETIAGYRFKASTRASLQGATQFPFKSAAVKTIKKYNLGNSPHWAHVEEIEL